MNADEVVAEISRRCWRFGVAVLLSPGRTVDSDGYPCGGYFDEDRMTLVVAMGRNEATWLEVLVHEYCHVTQYIEGMPLWDAYRDEVWDWLGGKRIADPKGAVASIRELEADCERRAVRLSRELNAPVDLEMQCRAANAYLHFHNVMLETRKWYRPDVVMREMPELLAAANPTIDKDFTKTPAKLRKALLTCV